MQLSPPQSCGAGSLSPPAPSPAAAHGASHRSMAPSKRWCKATLDANMEREAPADSTITQGSPSLLLNGRHFSVSFPLPLELKLPFCSKTCQAEEILLPFQLTNSPLSSSSRKAHPTGHPFPGVCRIAGRTNGPHPMPSDWPHIPGLGQLWAVFGSFILIPQAEMCSHPVLRESQARARVSP